MFLTSFAATHIRNISACIIKKDITNLKSCDRLDIQASYTTASGSPVKIKVIMDESDMQMTLNYEKSGSIDIGFISLNNSSDESVQHITTFLEECGNLLLHGFTISVTEDCDNKKSIFVKLTEADREEQISFTIVRE